MFPQAALRATDEIFGTITVDNETLDDGVLIKADKMPIQFRECHRRPFNADYHVMREWSICRQRLNTISYTRRSAGRSKYIHMPPVMRDAQHKLSKRDGDASYGDFINKGYLKKL